MMSRTSNTSSANSMAAASDSSESDFPSGPAGETRLPGSGTTTAGPAFVVDPSCPNPLPNHCIPGGGSGNAVEAKDPVGLTQPPASLTEDEKGAALDPPVPKCCVPAPPVMEFDGDGNLLQA